ncbi:uncharacterized protein LOC123509009 [Portunus trituberculatus]|uniref:uncharacterized protein LOC123509009 n=1 Tax=Portunus trituberculatus TaxID=210409 RepID=UPI001E1D1DD9|nr:uncharacterized protein LOC123509009 [Portunus trituberculatus]XP_045119085.1 uncharacterized protein LOC123509009 [Portunus trituberculatus]XP_045119086.1 uncharacterized protein LOC123509009 [Portunus trituberculatus]XP_045119087.1 uncharacterized protein LOC123509009 [Portunus trituberculatus]XP_045119089.1 uncharacterized protein LOC123509009 [Portunus trituberculatus]XP_045119090.1 uncharacterized protein LOC123509009 [Portunus trituberculatus]XP_045119091.1 uncharacterized protein LO
MGFNLQCVANSGVTLGVLDLLHGLATLAFYSYQFGTHFNCRWSHGIRWCRYYLEETNHSQRVDLGMGEGVLCIIFAILLIVALRKYNWWLVWAWLTKALAVVGLNGYFITVWVLETSRHYHQFWNRHNYDQNQVFLLAGIILTLAELIFMFVFCCIVGSFTHKIRKQRVPTMETDI